MSDSQPPNAPATKPPHDSAATKRRLLLAATHEFTERGIAGARVDRIALAARSNKRLIYDYFVDKDGLFDAVMDAHIDLIVEAVPIDAADLPGYAGRLFTYSVEHPELVRLVTWARLEHRLGPASNASRSESYHRRLAAIEAAQLSGHVPTTFTPTQIVRLIESLAVGWTTATSAFLADAEAGPVQDPETYREVVAESVRRILT